MHENIVKMHENGVKMHENGVKMHENGVKCTKTELALRNGVLNYVSERKIPRV